MKYYIIAGEASGDLHASNLIKELKRNDKNAIIKGFGGDLMKAAGAEITLHYREMAFMMVWEVLKNLKKIKQNLQLCKNDIVKFKPDAVILVDYAGFNLKIARYVKSLNIPVFYYISPKVWAWQKSRVKLIKKYVDQMYVILPFEKDFYKLYNYNVEYLGNPLVDAIVSFDKKGITRNAFLTDNNLEDKPIIALLSGSRKQEIDRCLPEMLAVIDSYPDYQFVIGGAPSITPDFYKKYIEGTSAKIVYGQTYQLLNHADAAVVTSGTATLETALFHVPEVVVYKTSIASILIISLVVNITFFSLVNLIMGKETVKELLQVKLAREIKTELDKILFDKKYRDNILAEYKVLNNKMGTSGVSERVAKHMIQKVKHEIQNKA